MRFSIFLAAATCAAFSATAQTVNYTYDELGRLVEVENDRNTPDPNDDITTDYVYDAAGNRTQVAIQGTGNQGGGGASTYSIDNPVVTAYSIDNPVVTEGDLISFTITRTGGLDSPDTVLLSTVGQFGATAPGDFDHLNTTFVFEATTGPAQTKIVTVQTHCDTEVESQERVRLYLYADETETLLNDANSDAIGTSFVNDGPNTCNGGGGATLIQLLMSSPMDTRSIQQTSQLTPTSWMRSSTEQEPSIPFASLKTERWSKMKTTPHTRDGEAIPQIPMAGRCQRAHTL